MNIKKLTYYYLPSSYPKKFKRLLLPLLLNLLGSSISYASIVRGDIDYQYFRDFAENKGPFSVGASNINIYNKQGQSVGMMLPNIPMMDFSVINSNGGIATLVDPQYIVSVAHNRGYRGVQFGAIASSHPDNHTFTYNLVHNNNYAKNGSSDPYHIDYQFPRLQKLVTEVIPIETVPEANARLYTNRSRYPIVIRAGSGTQQIMVNGQKKGMAGAYVFLTGSATPRPEMAWVNQNSFVVFGRKHNDPGNLHGDIYGPMVSIGLGGDSGSGVFVYDAQEEKWKFLATMQSVYSSGRGNNAFVARPHYHNKIKNANISATIHNPTENALWQWTYGPNATHEIYLDSDNNQSYKVDVFKSSLSGWQGQINQRINHGKDIIFTGEKGQLYLQGLVNQGAGALIFNADYTVSGKTGITWQGAGINIAENKTVIWKIANPERDRLSKIGAGTLHIQGVGINAGDASIGDGLVILDQQADENGKRQAFNTLGIVSGRPTVRINSADQMNWNNLYFGFRGGKLDVNGFNIHFKRIQNVDSGAQIVNHNLVQSSTITLTGNALFTDKDIKWGSWNKAGADLYEYTNNHRGNRKDYFILKGNASAYYPLDQRSDSNWEYLGSGEQGKALAIQTVIKRKNVANINTAFNGYFGEDNIADNGELHIHYKPNIVGSTLLLSGGSYLNGTFKVSNGGTLILSGRPVPHAYDHINKKEVVYDNEWLSQQFAARKFIIKDDSKLIISRNVDKVLGDIQAQDNSTIQLGFINNHATVCVRSDYTGNTTCRQPNYQENILEEIPRLQYQDNITLTDNAQLTIGKTNFKGHIHGLDNSQVTLSSEANWTLTSDSKVHHLNMIEGSTIYLSGPDQSKYQHLQIQGNLTGSGLFHYQTNLNTMQSDRVTVLGYAQGNFKLYVQNTGKEPKKTKDWLTLFETRSRNTNLNVTLANPNNSVDLGAYRYTLIQDGDKYSLYNQLLEQEINKEAEAKRKTEEEAKRKAEEEAKRKTEEEAMLKAQEQSIFKTKEDTKSQATIISRYTNTGLSEFSAHVHEFTNLNQGIFRYLTEKQSSSGVWFNQGYYRAIHQSDLYRAYTKQTHQTQFGGNYQIQNNIGHFDVGAIYTFSESHHAFDDSINGNSQNNMFSLYAKQNITQDIFVATNLGYLSSKHIIQTRKNSRFQRSTTIIGISTGKHFTYQDINTQIAVGINHNAISPANYQIDDAQIDIPKQNLVSYHMQIGINKAFDITPKFTLIPQINVAYTKYTQKAHMNVNGYQFSQAFSDYTTVGLVITARYKQTRFNLQTNYGKGKETSKTQSIKLKLQYLW